MQHAPLYSVPRMLLQVASSINDDTSLPLRVPDSTINFLHELGKQCNHSTKPLGRFLLTVRCSQLADQVIRLVLPEEFFKLRMELQDVQCTKEEAVAQYDWKRAAALRDRAD